MVLVRNRSKGEIPLRANVVCCCPNSGHAATAAPCPFGADIVVKVGNRTTPKISRKQISRQPYRCNALHRRCEGPWSFSWETMRTLTSPYMKRISSPRKFRSSPQKDFCNNICHEATSNVQAARKKKPPKGGSQSKPMIV
jgi:hypothetical protein